MSEAILQNKVKTTNATALPQGILQRACACGAHTMAGGECEGCKKKRQELQRSAANGLSEPTEAPPIVHEVLRSPGHPLDAATRAFMEPRFGHDFSGVRVHTDAKAAESARAVTALAYTVGSDIVFGAGQYAPQTRTGLELLAHEMTHVVQQNGNSNQYRSMTLLSPAHDSEREADDVAHKVVSNSVSYSISGAADASIRSPHVIMADALHSGLPGFGTPRQSPALAFMDPNLQKTGLARMTGRGCDQLPAHCGHLSNKLLRKTVDVDEQDVEQDYSDIERQRGSWNRKIRQTLTSLRVKNINPIVNTVNSFSAKKKIWLTYAFALIKNNQAQGLNSTEAVLRLVAYVNRPQGILYNPLRHSEEVGTDIPKYGFEKEVLIASGWFETKLTGQLGALKNTELVQIQEILNPGAGDSAVTNACNGNALDSGGLNTELPRLIAEHLEQLGKERPHSVERQGFWDAANIIQETAMELFSPYAEHGRGKGNTFLEKWKYSEHMKASTSLDSSKIVIDYLDNVARKVGRAGLFSRLSFKEGCNVDEKNLGRIIYRMARDLTIKNIAMAIIRSTSSTEHIGDAKTVYISFNRSGDPCSLRWSVIRSMCHELVHVMAHDQFRANTPHNQVFTEGFTEVLGVQLYNYIITNQRLVTSLRSYISPTFEAGYACDPEGAVRLKYGNASLDAEHIREIVGDSRFKAAYFLGNIDLIGVK